MSIKQELRHVILDTETTGLNPRKSAVVEIAAIVGKIGHDRKLLEKSRFQALALPEEKYLGESADKALEINGITREALKRADVDVIVAKRFHAWLDEWSERGKYPLRLHSYNVKFDSGMLDNNRWRIPKWVWGQCMMVNTAKIMGAGGHLSQIKAQRYYEIPDPKTGDRHRAMFDTEIATAIFSEMYSRGWIE